MKSNKPTGVSPPQVVENVEISKDGEDNAKRHVTRRRVLKMAGAALALNILPQFMDEKNAFSATQDRKNMKIIVLTGSPHKNGTSAMLADEFITGATSKGHTIVRFDAAMEQISPCQACYYCKSNNGECIQQDSMGKILPEVLSADMIVLVTPIYYYGMCAQLKTLLDRFFAKESEFRKHAMKSALLATCGGKVDWSMDTLLTHYQSLCKYLPWEDKGKVLAMGVPARKDIEGTKYPAEARALGESL